MSELVLGYSPFNAPHINPIEPFHEIFDAQRNLLKERSLDHVDAVLLWGGSDICTSFYNEFPYTNSGPLYPTERDLFEWELCREAVKRGIPIIGVCRGAQLLCAFAGGKLIQHVNGHDRSHLIKTYDNKEFMVTSSHHQMMYPYDVKHELLGWASTPLANIYEPNFRLYCADMENRHHPEAEVVYFPDINGFAIQSHPEWQNRGDAINKWMFEEIEMHCFTKINNGC